MIDFISKLWPWKKIKKLEYEIVELRDTYDDSQNWHETTVLERDRLKLQIKEIREENLKLMSEVSTFRASLREFIQLCEKYT